ncbi:uncharacterized protein LY79DRAFT_130821 [Colletotrichum navitas]|uniref:Uncharacterized protein n=1 Tax=Colletotrichum navitas TaxID=681940 RepID=A0AAD8Q3S2_9PEZI|nr:uncharacterized protein LY79DRAFT_130821 [Colletotrichum navitas]KAK1594507.1 hypothetical protein LY79DRAFT_130821 [Colletotrichum navitas]
MYLADAGGPFVRPLYYDTDCRKRYVASVKQARAAITFLANPFPLKPSPPCAEILIDYFTHTHTHTYTHTHTHDTEKENNGRTCTRNCVLYSAVCRVCLDICPPDGFQPASGAGRRGKAGYIVLRSCTWCGVVAELRLSRLFARFEDRRHGRWRDLPAAFLTPQGM